MNPSDTNTAQALADELRLRVNYVVSLKHDRGRQILEIETLYTCIDRLRDLASLASQAAEQEPVAEWVRSPVGEFPQLVWERGYEAKIGDKLYAAPVREQSEREAELLDALADYLEKQDALDDREISGPNAEDYFKLVSRRNTARDFLDAAIAAKKEQQ